MKHYSKILFFAAALTGLASCAIEEVMEFPVERPENLAEYDYLKEYDVLKNYVDRSASPNFKLGVGVTASEFSKEGQDYLMAVANFDEVTPGNAFKHASVVGNDGSFKTETVSAFVDAARNAGTTIYGHTLAWHSQQNNKYLNSLIAPTVIPGEPEEGGDEELIIGDGGYCMKLTNQSGNGSDNWSAQVWYVFDKPLEVGTTYNMSIVAKGTAAYTIASWLKIGSDGEQIYHMPGNFQVGTEWKEIPVMFTPDQEGVDRFIFNFGDMPAGETLYIDEVKVIPDGEETNLVKNGDFEEKHVDGWAYWTPGQNYAISEDGEGYMVTVAGPVGVPGYCMKLTNQSGNGSDNWSAQVWYVLEKPLEPGVAYTLSMSTKGTAAYNIGSWLKYGADGEQVYHMPGSYQVTTDWLETSNTFTPEKDGVDRFILNFGDFPQGETILVDNVKLIADGEEENLIKNGDFEEKHVEGWAYWTPGQNYAISEDGEGYPDIKEEEPEPGYAMNLTSESGNGTDNWSAQVWYVLDKPLEVGTTYTLSFMAKGTTAYSMGSWLKLGPDGDQIYHMPGNFNITTQWTEVSNVFTPDSEGADRFIFNFGDYAKGEVISIDNIKLVADGEEENLIKNGDFEEQHVDGWEYWTPGQNYAISELGGGYVAPVTGGGGGSNDTYIEKTPEEKRIFIIGALDAWIRGIMSATEGYVTVWDAVNEPISGIDGDGDGYYDLQSAANGDPENNFYWQDYIGNEDYVPTVVKLANKYYSGNGDLKLFINDYNLESDWDDNQKLKSLIHWIDVWEKRDIIYIDGIGTQMHVSFYANPTIQASKEEHIIKMFELMADTGKLVKISELDMGYVDADGNTVPTASMTEEMHKQMAAFYTFIISKYFEIIPADQQYGITQWCAKDAAGELGTGWRGGEPVGLWDVNNNRKHTYAGFAQGLNGFPADMIPEETPEEGDQEEETPGEEATE